MVKEKADVLIFGIFGIKEYNYPYKYHTTSVLLPDKGYTLNTYCWVRKDNRWFKYTMQEANFKMLKTWVWVPEVAVPKEYRLQQLIHP